MAHILMVGMGQLACPLSEHWLEQGHQVTGIRRGQQAPAGVQLLPQDLLHAAKVQLPSASVDLVYIILTPAERSEQAYHDAFVTLPQRVLGALAKQQPLPPVVFVSSTAVYGDGKEAVDEASPTVPSAFNGRVLLQAEEQVRGLAPSTAVRFSGIYGPTRQGRVALAKRLLQGQAEVPKARWSSRIHSADVVGLLLHLGQRWLAGDAPPAVVVGSDEEPVVNLALLNWLAAQQGGELALTWGQVAGRPVHSRYLAAGHYTLQHPTFRTGYASATP